MRFVKYLSIVLVLQLILLSTSSAETLMRDGVVVSYELGAEEPGKFSIEIQNDNRNPVEVILNVYAMLAGRALGSIHCNENFLKTYELEAGEILRVTEPGCEPKKFRTLEAYVKIIGVKEIKPPQEPVLEVTQETPLVSSTEKEQAPVQEELPVVEASPTPVVEKKETVAREITSQKKEEGQTAEVSVAEVSSEPSAQEETPPSVATPDLLVEMIQTLLSNLGYDPGPADGFLGEKTETAIRAFQENKGLAVDGKPSIELSDVLVEESLQVSKKPATEEALVTEEKAKVEEMELVQETAVPEKEKEPSVIEDKTAVAVQEKALEAEKAGMQAPVAEEVPESLRKEEPATVENVLPITPEQKEAIASEEKIFDPVVADIQQALQGLGYNPGPIDGLIGKKTETAITAFQQDNNLVLDGLPSAGLLSVLFERQEQQMEQQQGTPLQEGGIPAARLPGEELVVGILLDGTRTSQFLELLNQELLRLFGDDYTLEVPEEKTLFGDWTRERIAKNLDQLLNDPEVDVIIALDVIASHEAAHRQNLNKPVFAPLILDEKLQQLPLEDPGSGVHNLSYLVSLPSVETGMEMFRRMASFQHVAILVSRYYDEAISEIQEYIRDRQAMLTREGLAVTLILIEDSVDEVIRRITTEIDALYILPIFHFSDAENQQLFAALNDKKLLTFSHLGRQDVEEGVLAAIAPKSDFQRLARRIALNIQRALEGEDPSTFSVYFRQEGEERLVINMATARQIGFYPTFAALMEAELLNEKAETTARQLTLNAAVDEAIEANLALLSKQQDVTANQENIAIANAARLPQIDLSALGSAIDSDRATPLGFGGAERLLSGSATLNQIIYSDKANANVSIQKSLQQGREDELEQVKLDIILLAATGYLDILRGKTLLTIQKENLNLTQSNLEVARTRVAVGAAGKGEVYRWESALATDRQRVINAQNNVKQAEYNLNRILNRPQEEEFATSETEMTEPFVLDQMPLVKYINNRRIFELLRDFAVAIGLENAPELARADALLAAQKRLISGLFREYVVPSFAFQGDATRIFAEGGEGADGLEGVPPEMADAFASPNDNAWFVGVGLSWPIFSGGGKRSEHRKAKLELERLLTDKAAIAQAVEQRTRSAVYQTGNSYVKIRFAQDGAEAATRTLDLVTIAYKEGLATILDMIDAQNVKIVAEELVANAVYSFLLDLMNSQRATNTFEFMMSDEERQQGYQDFEEFLRQQGINITE